MWFRESIPEEVLFNQNASAFVNILDLLQEGKSEAINEALRANNPLLCTDKKWLIRYIRDFFPVDIPEALPCICLQQFALNLQVMLRMRGTLEGMKLLCEGAILGTATFTNITLAGDFYYLFPDSILDTYITDTNDEETFRYLVDNNDFLQGSSISVSLKSKVFAGISANDRAEIISFIKDLIKMSVGFSKDISVSVTTTTLAAYVYPDTFNDYFKN